ncbi:hypothetical protein BpHYR1_002946 [Brachionus plicatilis]|uniref:Uncharacterized protein n=1 Tax=Brachionus plicatilis TaxID=10195 RepID=A0A3M7T4R4_BRAPC|nr:hypothetical protein BpHYR1_002946 [Brachionus plicatilis]
MRGVQKSLDYSVDLTIGIYHFLVVVKNRSLSKISDLLYSYIMTPFFRAELCWFEDRRLNSNTGHIILNFYFNIRKTGGIYQGYFKFKSTSGFLLMLFVILSCKSKYDTIEVYLETCSYGHVCDLLTKGV